MMRFVFSSFVLCFLIFNTYGQQVKWPDDPDKKSTAAEKLALYSDYMKAGKLQEAVAPLEWLLTNTPDLTLNIYIHGGKIYEDLSEKEKDPSQKTAYEDKALALYDQRIKYFDNEADVLNRKAYSAYKFHKDQKDRYQELFDLFEKVFGMNPDDIQTNNLVAYMDVVRRYNASGGNLSDDEVLDRYQKVTDLLDHKEEQGENAESIEKTRSYIDKMLTAMVTVDCNFIENNLGTKLKANPNDYKLAKKIMGLALSSNCSDNPIFLEAAQVVQKNEPSFGIAKILGIKSASEEKYDLAEQYYNEAIELADDNSKKADIYLNLANMFRKQNNKPKARSLAMQAVSADPSRKDAFKLIGDLYYSSFQECSEKVNQVADRAVYLAAYKMYEKAGDQEMMNAASEQFPSSDDIFALDLKEGEAYKVGCWINEEVVIQRRPV